MDLMPAPCLAQVQWRSDVRPQKWWIQLVSHPRTAYGSAPRVAWPILAQS